MGIGAASDYFTDLGDYIPPTESLCPVLIHGEMFSVTWLLYFVGIHGRHAFLWTEMNEEWIDILEESGGGDDEGLRRQEEEKL